MSLNRIRGASPQQRSDEIATGAAEPTLRFIVTRGRRRHDAPRNGPGTQRIGGRILPMLVGHATPSCVFVAEDGSSVPVKLMHRSATGSVGSLSHPNSGLPEFGTLRWPKSDISD